MSEPITVVAVPQEDPDFRVGIPAFQVDFERTQRAGFYSEHCVDDVDWSTEEGYILISDLRSGKHVLDLGINRGEECELVFETEVYDGLTYAGSWIEHQIPTHRFQFHELEGSE